mmetsp:Transcript_21271/g.43164  ORF Transcript_21271/g.43164 Transcript_21271/m.43164 type:complete len:224 (-) Transcript_21271:50-721(-)
MQQYKLTHCKQLEIALGGVARTEPLGLGVVELGLAVSRHDGGVEAAEGQVGGLGLRVVHGRAHGGRRRRKCPLVDAALAELLGGGQGGTPRAQLGGVGNHGSEHLRRGDSLNVRQHTGLGDARAGLGAALGRVAQHPLVAGGAGGNRDLVLKGQRETVRDSRGAHVLTVAHAGAVQPDVLVRNHVALDAQAGQAPAVATECHHLHVLLHLELSEVHGHLLGLS